MLVKSVTHVLNHFCYLCFEPAPGFGVFHHGQMSGTVGKYVW